MPRKPCPELSFHSRVKRWYKLIPIGRDDRGKPKYEQHYFGKINALLHEAWAEYKEWKRDKLNPVKAVHADNGRPKGGFVITAIDIDPRLPDEMLTPENQPILIGLGALRGLIDDKLSKSDRRSIYNEFVDVLIDALKSRQAVNPPPKKIGLTLSEIITFWEVNRKPTTDYRRKVKARFDNFKSIIGDIHLSELTADHIRRYIHSLERKGLTGNNRAHHLREVKAVLNFLYKPAAQKASDHDKVRESLPYDLKGLTSMMNVDASELTDPDESNTEPFPVDDFRKIWEKIETADDLQFRCIWLLACQAGLNMTDFGRLTWGGSLVVEGNGNGKLPHVRLPRIKRGKGKRYIPLAPVTVDALKRYRESLSPDNQVDGALAFLCQGKINRNRPVSPDGIRDSFQDYQEQAGVSDHWTYKHLRNVGPNVRVACNLPIDMGWAFLGQTWHLGEAQKYEYADPARLLPLVEAITARYLTPIPKPKKGKRSKTPAPK